MVRLLDIAFLLLLSHISLVAANAIPLVPGESITLRALCARESYDI